MPTLVSVPLADGETAEETAGETAHASDVTWMSSELAYDQDATNDCTISGSVLESCWKEIKVMETVEKQISEVRSRMETVSLRAVEHNNNIDSTVDDSATLSESRIEAFMVEKALAGNLDPSRHEDSTLNTSQGYHMRLTRRERTIGRNEQDYTLRYCHFVATKLEEFRRYHPGRLLDYRHLNPVDQGRERERVMKLLSRLGIAHRGGVWDDESRATSLSHGRESHPTSDNDETVEPSMALLSPNADRSLSLLSPNEASNHAVPALTFLSPPVASTRQGASMPFPHPRREFQNTDLSRELLSPTDFPYCSGTAEISIDLLSPCLLLNHSDSSTQPIELARSTRQYDSPTEQLYRKKRFASVSGKRGADYVRPRKQSWDSCESEGMSSSKLLESSIRKLSLVDRIFTASQSPISPHCTRSLPDDDKSDGFVEPHISFGNEALSPVETERDSIEDTTMVERRVRWDLDGARRPFRSIPGNIGLKKGAVVHFKSLPIEKNRKGKGLPPTQSFPDTLDKYEGRVLERLRELYTWMRDREGDDGSPTAVVLSLTEQQVIDVTLGRLLESLPLETKQWQSSSNKDTRITGQTLIVVRGKETLDEWSRTFREGSACSVLNHAMLPVKERKTPSTALKCGMYDAVLTTFDAIKSPDVTVALDSNGYVLMEKVGIEDGWYTSRSGSQGADLQHCKQLSVLHRVSWLRVVFVDIIGRKGFLVKPDTSRALAARALTAESR
jgi:hypothetical protein